jgi:thiamine biosynthesis protein ThiI
MDNSNITKCKLFFSLDKELEFINKMNREGWKLVYIKCGCFYTFEKTEPDEYFTVLHATAKEKVLELAKILTDYTLRIRVHVVSLTKIQELIRDNCDEDYFTLLLRRYMMAISVKLAHQYDCEAIITGESLGQVASQTMKAINVTNVLSDIPIYRPLIGMDKEEIISISRKIGAFETSVLPFEDCCTVFTPRHPRTRPELERVIEEENKLNFKELVDEAYETKQIVVVRAFGDNKFE